MKLRKFAGAALPLMFAALLFAACDEGEPPPDKAANSGGDRAPGVEKRPQLDKGTFAVFVLDVTEDYPVAWAWKSEDIDPDVEHWLYYRPAMGVGFMAPGEDLPLANLKFLWHDEDHADVAAFKQWVIAEYTKIPKSVTEAELELHKYKEL